jgi:hypothetical protein
MGFISAVNLNHLINSFGIIFCLVDKKEHAIVCDFFLAWLQTQNLYNTK